MPSPDHPSLTYTHTRLLVDDYVACLEFYRDDLGFTVAWGNADSGYADLRTAGTTIALFDRSEMAAAIERPNTESPTGDSVAMIFQVPPLMWHTIDYPTAAASSRHQPIDRTGGFESPIYETPQGH